MTALKRQAPGALLLGTAEFRWHCVDRGIGWVYDQYGMARADLFRAGSDLGKPTGAVRARRILDLYRAQSLLPGVLRVTGGEHKGDWSTSLIVGTPHVHAAVNPKAWAGWTRTGCAGRLTDRGTVLWFAPVRGKQALFGVLLPVRLGPIQSVAA